jgi:hypothetical protein
VGDRSLSGMEVGYCRARKLKLKHLRSCNQVCGRSMLVLRCTRKLLGRLHASPDPVDAPSTTVLGDWYATILMVRPAHLVLLVNERSRLPIVLPARELSTLLERIPDAVADTLSDLGVESHAIEREREEMRNIVCAPTANRSVVGAMNEFVFLIQLLREDGPLPHSRALSYRLTDNLVGVGKRDYVHPRDEVRRLLGRDS